MSQEKVLFVLQYFQSSYKQMIKNTGLSVNMLLDQHDSQSPTTNEWTDQLL